MRREGSLTRGAQLARHRAREERKQAMLVQMCTAEALDRSMRGEGCESSRSLAQSTASSW